MLKTLEMSQIVNGKNIRNEKDSEITELAASILAQGLINPILVQKRAKDGKYVVIAGRLKQQRWKDENEQMHSAIVIKVAEISLPPMPKSDGSGQQAYQPEPVPDVSEESGDMFDGNEVIPF